MSNFELDEEIINIPMLSYIDYHEIYYKTSTIRIIVGAFGRYSTNSIFLTVLFVVLNRLTPVPGYLLCSTDNKYAKSFDNYTRVEYSVYYSPPPLDVERFKWMETEQHACDEDWYTDGAYRNITLKCFCRWIYLRKSWTIFANP